MMIYHVAKHKAISLSSRMGRGGWGEGRRRGGCLGGWGGGDGLGGGGGMVEVVGKWWLLVMDWRIVFRHPGQLMCCGRMRRPLES